MSKITDMAEAEAEAVEAAEGDTAASDDDTEASSFAAPELRPDEPAGDEPADEPSANVSMDKAVKQLQAEDERHAKRVAQIMGDDFALVHVCSGCQEFAAGFTLTAPNDAPPLVTSPDYQRCEKCNGYGMVLTGSLAEHGQTQTCLNCNGQGFINTPAPLPQAQAPAAVLNPNHSLADQLRAQGYMVLDPPPNQTPQAV